MNHKSSSQDMDTNYPAPIQTIFAQVNELWEDDQPLENSQDLEDFEQAVHNINTQLQALLVEQKIQQSLDSASVIAEGAKLAKDLPFKTTNKGKRFVSVTTMSGICILVYTSYFTGKSRIRGRQAKRGKGVYPGLLLLGIHDHCTPGLTSEVGVTVAASCSFEEAKDTLRRRGIDLNPKTIQNLSYRMAQRARLLQQSGQFDFGEDLQGRRVVISTDGGRVRIRTKKRGKKTPKGRNRYHTHWREPKIMIIYVTDEHGRRDRTFAPFVDGLIQGPNAIFSLMKQYLENLGIGKADNVLFVADGAQWIWDRVKSLMKELEVEQFYELLDFYHAVEHVAKVASLRKSLKPKKRKQWIKRQRKLLISGKVEKVIEAIKLYCKGRNSGKIRTELNYFRKHSSRMQYDIMAKLGLPKGSGAIESAVRRVVNLRIKGPGIFWKKESAEAILMLRSYYKSGRWNMLKQLTISGNPLSMI